MNYFAYYTDKLKEKPVGRLSRRNESQPGAHTPISFTHFQKAVESRKADVLDNLLRRAGNDHVNSRTRTGCTLLYLAASYGDEECVKLLLEYGADINAVDAFGISPKLIAELNSKESIVRMIQSEGKYVCIRFDCKCKSLTHACVNFMFGGTVRE